MPYPAGQARTSLRDTRTSLPPVKRASSVTPATHSGEGTIALASSSPVNSASARTKPFGGGSWPTGRATEPSAPGIRWEPGGARGRSGYPSSFSSLSEAQDAGQPPP